MVVCDYGGFGCEGFGYGLVKWFGFGVYVVDYVCQQIKCGYVVVLVEKVDFICQVQVSLFFFQFFEKMFFVRFSVIDNDVVVIWMMMSQFCYYIQEIQLVFLVGNVIWYYDDFFVCQLWVLLKLLLQLLLVEFLLFECIYVYFMLDD